MPVMRSIRDLLTERLRDAMAKMGIDGNPAVQPSQDEKFGDYQSNAAMACAKQLGRKPRELAQQIVESLRIDDVCEPAEIAGPGFINLRLKPAFIAQQLSEVPAAPDRSGDRVGLPSVAKRETVAVDLSSPNLAKEMHVGHLRSTVIGDCVCRVLEFLGHEVHRENHVGDWGTQFGMLVAYLRRAKPEIVERPDELVIRDLESFYVEAKALFDRDDDFKVESRETVVALQRGDPNVRRIWKAFCDESLRHCHEIYQRLEVRLEDRGESYYADLMDEVVARLERTKDDTVHGVRESEGALCVFLDGFTTREGEPLPLIVRKSDGGHNYATSDLATIVHRVEHQKATRIVYVVGIAQKQHFDMVFAAAKKVGFVPQHVCLEHLGFGSMLRKDGRPFKTREGGTVKLKDLLDEAVARARKVIEQQEDEDSRRDQSLTPEQIAQVSETVGIAAVKYFDLSHSLTSDYKFDLDIMLAMEGNTAPYMLYAYARIASIGRKAGIDFRDLPDTAPIMLEHPSEVALGKKLVQFPEVIDIVARELRPNVLTDYLFELSRTFSRFYDKKLGVRVIDASPDILRISRLRLCDITARILKLGLHLLGIRTVDQM
jgi:arginyl-tRNA synthetase